MYALIYLVSILDKIAIFSGGNKPPSELIMTKFADTYLYVASPPWGKLMTCSYRHIERIQILIQYFCKQQYLRHSLRL